MRYRTLPGTDLTVSAISLGTVPFGTLVDEAASFVLLDAYLEAGGTFLDTAHIYADWLEGDRAASEKTLGRWWRARGRPSGVVVATKGGHPVPATSLVPRLAPDQIGADLDASLHALDLERIDLYYLHRDDPQRPVEEIVETLNAAVRAGKVRYLGVSNWQPSRIRAANAYATAHGLQPFVASQVLWSLATPNPGAFAGDLALMDEPSLAYYAGAGLGVTAYTSQAGGFFTIVAARGLEALPAERRRAFENTENLARLARTREVAEDLGVSITAVVLAFITSYPGITGIAVVGPSSRAHLRDSLAGADLVLSPEQVRYLAIGQDHRG